MMFIADKEEHKASFKMKKVDEKEKTLLKLNFGKM